MARPVPRRVHRVLDGKGDAVEGGEGAAGGVARGRGGGLGGGGRFSWLGCVRDRPAAVCKPASPKIMPAAMSSAPTCALICSG